MNKEPVVESSGNVFADLGFSPEEATILAMRAELMARVTALAREGVAVLYTEHNMDAVFGVADRVLVLIDGLLAASGTPQEVALDATVRSRYLGRGFQAGDVHV